MGDVKDGDSLHYFTVLLPSALLYCFAALWATVLFYCPLANIQLNIWPRRFFGLLYCSAAICSIVLFCCPLGYCTVLLPSLGYYIVLLSSRLLYRSATLWATVLFYCPFGLLYCSMSDERLQFKLNYDRGRKTLCFMIFCNSSHVNKVFGRN
ncbi:hypothetical protein NE237_030790 [Protea cynaroides]|uniref:Uncharacterized protein n=1 Tax=Protea cynaroides TaxID=273540 RepID=A0A9Q0JXM4_9MAGN|nr:hypothetical protein NE237_030790 [Protea cynaroides]